MSSKMTCKDQTARVEFDARDDILVGRLVGITDVVSFHADSVAGLRAAFEEAVDDLPGDLREARQGAAAERQRQAGAAHAA